VAKWQCSQGVSSQSFQGGKMEKRSVKTELHGDNWIRNLSGINTTNQVEEFTLLFMTTSSKQLLDQNDSIVWK
jgi:hypothetical protein